MNRLFLLVGLLVSGFAQAAGSITTPVLTKPLICSFTIINGCTPEKPYCSNDTAVVAELKNKFARLPMVWEVDLFNKSARLRGEGDRVRIDNITAIPGMDVINLQGVTADWNAWTLTFEGKTGKATWVDSTPGFTMVALGHCRPKS